METSKSRITKFINELNVNESFKRIHPSLRNIENVYEHNYAVWCWKNSNERSGDNNPVNGWFDNYKTLKFSGVRENGGVLDEKKFIKEELRTLSSVSRLKLDIPKQNEEENRLDAYIEFLKNREEKLLSDNSNTAKNQHSNYFKGNAFQLWNSLFEALKITESSRRDIRFVLESMQKDGYIHERVREVDFREWLNETYELAIDKTPFVDIKDTSNRNNRYRISVYSELKQAYKNG